MSLATFLSNPNPNAFVKKFDAADLNMKETDVHADHCWLPQSMALPPSSENLPVPQIHSICLGTGRFLVRDHRVKVNTKHQCLLLFLPYLLFALGASDALAGIPSH
jgi:hypothetical protein